MAAISLPTAAPAQTPCLSRLIDEVRAVVRRENDAKRVGAAVAELLQPYLGRADFLADQQLKASPEKYQQHILHVEPDGSFSIVALVWLPGQATPIHDHVSWCVVGVHTGEEHERVYRLTGGESDPHLVKTGEHRNPSGSIAALVPPGDIHQVANSSERVAVSLHIYGADIRALGSSIRRSYALEVRAAAGSAS